MSTEPQYLIRSREGDYFSHWDSTPWDTVKRYANWTLDKPKAASNTISGWYRSGYADITAGFSGASLERDESDASKKPK